MLTVSTGEQHGAVANRNDQIRSHCDSSEDGQARKKARCGEAKSPGTNDSNSKSSSSKVQLRVDVNASRLASPRGVPNVRRSPIAFVGEDHIISDETSNAASDAGKFKEIQHGLQMLMSPDYLTHLYLRRTDFTVGNEEPFVIARKLLRRRHVRKEQLRKEREARGAQGMRETRNRRNKRKATSERGGRSSGSRGGNMVAAILPGSTSATLPQLSPMLLKANSLSNMTLKSPIKPEFSTTGNDTWTVEVGDSPEGKRKASGKGPITPDSVPPVAFIEFPRTTTSNMARVSFSPLRSRNHIM
jgi:hypothetical protein